MTPFPFKPRLFKPSLLEPILLRPCFFAGRAIQALAALAFMGWMQGRDPDCLLVTDSFSQLRLCSPEFAGEPTPSSTLGKLALILGVFLLGALLVRHARRLKLRRHRNARLARTPIASP